MMGVFVIDKICFLYNKEFTRNFLFLFIFIKRMNDGYLPAFENLVV